MIEATQALDQDTGDHSRQQQDIALASWCLRSGAVSERKLLNALRTWTIHGSISLADHLCEQGLVDKAAIDELSSAASNWLKTQQLGVIGANGSSSQSIILSTLDRIDPNGKIARLMGIHATAGTGLADAAGRRTASLNYRIVRKIGQGGLGRVWLAYDEQLQRYVAIKEVAGTNNPAALERFRREAVITGKLEHPGIVPVHQLGIDEDSGLSFYAMRFLGKCTLHDAILEYHERRAEGDGGPMLVRKLLNDFVSVCQAIGHAHSRKVIHRDLKPENIAIDDFGQVIVIDWGIAKTIDQIESTESADLSSESGSLQGTVQGQVLGTPMYMAPEQAAGRVDDLDETTDIYGLGAILFAILTGTAPHESTSGNAKTSTGSDLLSAITSQPTPDARAVDRSVDPALASICGKAMARKQYARYQSASELADDVQRWMAGEPVTACRESRTQQIARWIRQHQALSTAMSVIAIAAIVTLATLAATVRENRSAAKTLAFEELYDYENELSVLLESDTVGLIQNARFMSTLPPIQAIINSRSTSSERAGDETESEDVWRERLSTIYAGLLQANPSYLSVSYLTVNETSASSLVRVERSASNADSVRSVPTSRLKTLDDAEIISALSVQSHGDVALLIREEVLQGASGRRSVRLLAITPIFDESSGDLFGLVMLEADLASRIAGFLDRIGQETADIHVGNGVGEIWLSDDREGIHRQPNELSISNILPAFDVHADAEQMKRVADETEGWMTSRIELDSMNPQAAVRVVMRLRDR